MLSLLLLSGCTESKPVYDKVHNKSLLPLKCINIDSSSDDNQKIKEVLAPYYFKDCKQKLQLTIHKVTKCTAIESRTTGLGFGGYVRAEIYRDGDIIYKSQSDFVNDINSSIDRLTDRMFDISLLVKK